jgi:hypothetical protein
VHSENRLEDKGRHDQQSTLKSRVKREALLPVLTIFSSFEHITVNEITKKTGVIHG